MPKVNKRHRKIIRLFVLICSLMMSGIAGAQHDSVQTTPSDSTAVADSLMALTGETAQRKPDILDTLLNDSFINASFRHYNSIRNHIVVGQNYLQRDVPSIKEIKPRPPLHRNWIFWVIIGILCYIAGVRTFNQRNFKASLNSVFSMKITSKMWEEKGVIFSYITLQLFSIFVLISALFIDIWMEKKNIVFWDGALAMYLGIVVFIFALYAGKFIFQYFWGWVFRQNKFGLSMVSNIITTNNFVALIVFPFLIILIYINNPLVKDIFIKTIAATFILSVLYRMFRALILYSSYFRYPLVYLILYLCTFEISPWLIIIDILTE